MQIALEKIAAIRKTVDDSILLPSNYEAQFVGSNAVTSRQTMARELSGQGLNVIGKGALWNAL